MILCFLQMIDRKRLIQPIYRADITTTLSPPLTMRTEDNLMLYPPRRGIDYIFPLRPEREEGVKSYMETSSYGRKTAEGI